MPRRRLGVAVLVPPPLATEIDGLRRACGARQFGRIAPHVTLIPPVNVPVELVPDALAVLRAAAAGRARSGPLRLIAGPPGVFHAPPDEALAAGLTGEDAATDTLHLPVADPDGALAGLRAAVWHPPLTRKVSRPFVPHVTLADGITGARASAGIAALADYTVTFPVDRVHLLEERRTPEGRVWLPIADVPFQRPAVVDRGGVELVLHRSHLVDPEALALIEQPEPVPEGAEPLVLTARSRRSSPLGPGAPGDRVVGVATGWVRDGEAELTGLVVAEDQRGQGIGGQLRRAFGY
jgi:2'-5' RNA ligase